LSWKAQQQRAKQNDIGRPEWRKDLVRERADKKGNFGAYIIGDRNNQTVAKCLPPVLVRHSLLPLLNCNFRNEDIHRPSLDHNNFILIRIQPNETIENA